MMHDELREYLDAGRTSGGVSVDILVLLLPLYGMNRVRPPFLHRSAFIVVLNTLCVLARMNVEYHLSRIL